MRFQTCKAYNSSGDFEQNVLDFLKIGQAAAKKWMFIFSNFSLCCAIYNEQRSFWYAWQVGRIKTQGGVQ